MPSNPAPIKGLLIEDDLNYTRLLQIIFESNAPEVHLVQVDRLATGLESLAEGGVSVVLLDLSLPDSKGLDTFAKVHALVQEVPIVVLTALADETLALELMNQGAQDYLIKTQVNGPSLVRSLHYAIRRYQTEQELRSSAANFRSVIVRNADGIIIVDRQGVVRFSQPRTKRSTPSQSRHL